MQITYWSSYYETTKLIVEKQQGRQQYQSNKEIELDDDDENDINSNAKF